MLEKSKKKKEIFQQNLHLYFCLLFFPPLTNNWPCYNFQSPGTDETQQLQKALLDYLEENADTDASLVVSVARSDDAALAYTELWISHLRERPRCHLHLHLICAKLVT